MKVLITGSSGFVGKQLINTLTKINWQSVRLDRARISNNVFDENLIGADCFIHLAGRAHLTKKAFQNDYDAYASVNIDFTLAAASFAIKHKVKRFIFVSSIKVNGESSSRPFTELDAPNPEDAYGLTKWQAEQALWSLFENSQTDLVVVRPPLIYGPGVKANFKNLIDLCSSGVPMPFGQVNNKRSLIFLGNFVDFIVTCASHPKAKNQTFLISDDLDVSTTYLIKTIKASSGRSCLLIPLPRNILRFLFVMLGKSILVKRLCDDLQVDVSKAKKVLGWKPAYTFRQGIEMTLNGENK